MLILTRKAGDSVVIGDEIKISVLKVKSRKVRIGIEAPKATKIYRIELLQKQDSALKSGCLSKQQQHD